MIGCFHTIVTSVLMLEYLFEGIRTAYPVSHFLFRARSVLQVLMTDP